MIVQPKTRNSYTTKFRGKTANMKTWPLLMAIAVLSLAGCQPSNPSTDGTTENKASTKTSPENLTVAVIPKGTSHEFWKAVQAGAEKAGKELGVTVIWKGPFKEDNKDEQIKVVEDFVTKKVNGIALAPLDDSALRVPVTDAQAAGIPVLIFDSALKDVDTVSFVATDNKEAGKMGGRRLGELLGGKGSVLLLRYQEGSASTTEREEGFLEAMKEFPDIKVVSDNQFGGATVETAQTASENQINRFRTGETFSVNGIFCPNESTTHGMLRALENSSLAGKVKFVGFDSSAPLIKGLKESKIDALVVQNPEKMGELAVRNLVTHLKGEKVDKRIDTGATLMDAKTAP